jgi:hypothetical protein
MKLNGTRRREDSEAKRITDELISQLDQALDTPEELQP